jgi:hypothetical protein
MAVAAIGGDGDVAGYGGGGHVGNAALGEDRIVFGTTEVDRGFRQR